MSRLVYRYTGTAVRTCVAIGVLTNLTLTAAHLVVLYQVFVNSRSVLYYQVTRIVVMFGGAYNTQHTARCSQGRLERVHTYHGHCTYTSFMAMYLVYMIWTDSYTRAGSSCSKLLMPQFTPGTTTAVLYKPLCP